MRITCWWARIMIDNAEEENNSPDCRRDTERFPNIAETNR